MQIVPILTDMTAETKQWRCTHGHKWESPVKIVGLSIGCHAGPGVEAPELPQLNFCLLCFYEWCREHFGQVREDL